MTSELSIGAEVSRTITVDLPRTVDFLGEELRVYATPELVRDIEQTCLDFLLEHVKPGENSVGISIDLNHSAATLVGMTVQITATVIAMDGRKVSFKVTAADGLEEICSGTHSRFIVDVAKLRGRVHDKAQRALAMR
jgi:fluoroacetyl-CoA thioesterase